MSTTVQSPDGTMIYLSGVPEYHLASNYVGDPPVDRTYIYANQCSFPQGTVRCREIHLHTASLFVMRDGAILDSSGTDGIQEVTAADQHANGSSAYHVVFSTSKFELPIPLEIKATGGNGGLGYSPPDNSILPTAGGNAGDGANVTLIVDTDYDIVADKADVIINDTTRTAEQKIDDMINWAQVARLVTAPGKPDSISWVFKMKIDQSQPNMDPTGPLPHAINAATFLGLMIETVETLRENSSYFLSHIDCRAGRPGHGGSTAVTAKRAADGSAGKSGSLVTSNFTKASILDTTELVFHPDQVGLTIRDVENSYFVGTQASIADARSKLVILISRLSLLSQIKPTDTLFQSYAKNEFKTLAVLPDSISATPSSVTRLQSSLQLAKRYLIQIDQGYDFYRHESTWVPRASYKFYEDNFQTVLADFDSVQAVYFEYQKLAADETKRLDQIFMAQDAARSGEAQASADIITLGTELSQTASRIGLLQDEVPRKHKAVDDKLAEIAHEIESKPHLPSWKEFIGAATQLCFEPSKEMTAVQGASLTLNSMTEVENSAGDSVDKRYVVDKINVLGKGLDDLKEAIEVSALDPFLNVDDPGASKLLGQEDDIMDLLNQYRSLIGGELDDFKALFDDYVNTVIQRNNEVMHYNSLITLFLQTRTKLDAYRHDQDTLGSREAQTINSDIPALAVTIKAAYLDYTAKVLELLYDTQRALKYYALDPGTVNLSSLRIQGFPSTDLGARLKMKKGDILNDFVKATNSMSVDRQAYGIPQGQDGQPIRVDLTEWQLEMLKMAQTGDEYFTTIQIPYVTQPTSIEQSPFASMADVRVSNLHVYLEGAKTADGLLTLNLQHLGDEKIVTVYSDPMHFTHDRLVFPFQYDLTSKHTIRGGSIIVDETTFSLPGPFAYWRIGVSKTTNKHLDLSGITSGWLEFSGYSRSFR